MKCPLCGEWSSVIETRGVIRRRECANHHRFTTEEVIKQHRKIHNIPRHAARDALICGDPRRPKEIALTYGLTVERVREIRRLGVSENIRGV